MAAPGFLNIMAKIDSSRSILEPYTRILAAFRLKFMTKTIYGYYINLIARCIISRPSAGGGWTSSMSSIRWLFRFNSGR